MAIMAEWRGQTFGVSPEKLNALEGLSFGYSQISKRGKDEGQAFYENGKEPFKISFSSSVSDAAGTDVRSEIDKWESLVNRTGYLYVHGKPLGPILQLTKFNVRKLLLDDFGRMRTAEFSFNFEEYDENLSSVYDSTAVNISPSAEAKKDLSPVLITLASAPEISSKVGSRVRIIGFTYADGTSIPESVKNSTHLIKGFSGDKVILETPAGAVVYKRDLSLV